MGIAGIEKIIKTYLKCLESGNYEKMIKLFADNAIVFSPLYGKIKAADFYKKLFTDTSKSKITMLNIFRGSDKHTAAGYFRYDWVLKDGTPTSFECVDVFRFNREGKIKELKIIYDTSKVRPSFEKMKEK
jgi:ketosteroid isomerase-like protein